VRTRLVAQAAQLPAEDRPQVRNRIAGERQQHLECPRPCPEGNYPGGHGTNTRVGVVKQRAGHGVNPTESYLET